MKKLSEISTIQHMLSELSHMIQVHRAQSQHTRSQLTAFFLSGIRPQKTVVYYAERAHRLLEELLQAIKSAHTPTIEAALRNCYVTFDMMQKEACFGAEVSFLLGPNGLIQRLQSLFELSEDSRQASDAPEPPYEIFYSLLSSKTQEWSLVLRSLPATIHSRPLYEQLSYATGFLGQSDNGVYHAALELHVAPRQAVRLLTPGGPTRIFISGLQVEHFKYLYTAPGPHRFRIHADYSLTEEHYVQEHPSQIFGCTSDGS